MIKNWVQKFWALIILLILIAVALLSFANPTWYQTYQSLVWAAAALSTLILWSFRNKELDK